MSATSQGAPSHDVTGHDWMTGAWQFLVIRGALAVVFGLVAAIWPVSTAIALVVLWGVWAAVDGVSALATALRRGTHAWARVGHALIGLVGLLVAFVAFVRPGLTAEALTWVLGVWLVVRGVLDLALALTRTPPGPRGLLVLGGLVDLLLGVLFMANPGRAVVGIALAVGLVAIFWGVVFIATGLAARRELREWRAAEDSDDVSGAPEGHVRATPSEADIPSQPRGEAAARQEAPGTSA